MPLYDEQVTLLENRKINEKYFKLSFKSEKLARKVLPGQFLNVQVTEAMDPFLRRPFSYYRIQQSKIEVLYEIFGKATTLLAGLKKGDPLKVLGPLGKAFTLKPKKKKRVLVAGGVGVPPLVFLAEKYAVDYLLIGTKSKKEVLPRSELSKVKAKVLYSTDDGSYGQKGLVTKLLKQVIEKKGKDLFVQTCGPQPMMKAVIDLARAEGIDGEASIDEYMACGVGACLGCMVETPRGWVPSCTEGPVFNFKELTGSPLYG